jgi:hypothetical protein
MGTALLPAATTFLCHRGRIENIGGWRCGHISYQYKFHVCTRIFSRYFFVFMTVQQAKNLSCQIKKGRVTKILQRLGEKNARVIR